MVVIVALKLCTTYCTIILVSTFRRSFFLLEFDHSIYVYQSAFYSRDGGKLIASMLGLDEAFPLVIKNDLYQDLCDPGRQSK